MRLRDSRAQPLQEIMDQINRQIHGVPLPDEQGRGIQVETYFGEFSRKVEFEVIAGDCGAGRNATGFENAPS